MSTSSLHVQGTWIVKSWGWWCALTQRAGVAVDTVYASVGRKPALVWP